ncbi:MAG: DUF1343 domain-containing protein [Candidatus Aminicenantes bacterium]|nr:DUF1343 domain-containing protein [Candidatus Aminicenantes bacterium]
MAKIMNGIDVLPLAFKKIVGNRSFALVTGSATVGADGRPVYETVRRLAGERLRAIWSLQHGFFIDRQDNMVLSPSHAWPEMSLVVRSLYGKSLLPDESWLDGLDAVLVDVFDAGTRVYTFVNHLVMLMRALNGRSIEVIVLDRVNPLNGIVCEGPACRPDYFSMVGQLPVPMRHALTVGEYLSFALSYFGLDLQLTVVKARHWRRRDFWDGIWTYPSPNLPSLAAALVYPGAVMVEGTNLSEGRGTTRPFEFIGSPFLDHVGLRAGMERLRLSGVAFIPVFFKPEFSKFAGRVCRGLQVQVMNRSPFRSFEVYYEMIRLARHMHPGDFRWQEPPYEFEYKRPPIDMICGSPFIRQAIEKSIPFGGIRKAIEQELSACNEAVGPFLLYP